MEERKVPELPPEQRLRAICGDDLVGEYFRVGHLLSVLKLGVCKDCFDGYRTWRAFGDEHFADYIAHYDELKEEVEQFYEDERGA